ncbi:MAG: hypothetical protein Pars2KO_32970 [Parasphingorhabdus sp.]
MFRSLSTVMIGTILATVPVIFIADQSSAHAQEKRPDYRTVADEPVFGGGQRYVANRLKRLKNALRDAEHAKDTDAMGKLVENMRQLRSFQNQRVRALLEKNRKSGLTPDERKDLDDYQESAYDLDSAVLSGQRDVRDMQQANSYREVANEDYSIPGSEDAVEKRANRYFDAIKKAYKAGDTQNLKKLLEKVERLAEFQLKRVHQMEKLGVGKNSDYLEGGFRGYSRASGTLDRLFDIKNGFKIVLQKMESEDTGKEQPTPKSANLDGQSYRISPGASNISSRTKPVSDMLAQGPGLTGHWSTSFFCNGQKYPSTVRVEDNGSSISGYMVTSNPCISAGGEKFAGNSKRKITCVGEEASKIGTRTYTDRLFNYPRQATFRVCRRTFRRMGPEV